MSDEQLLELLRYGWLEPKRRPLALTNGTVRDMEDWEAPAPVEEYYYEPGELEELMAEMTQRGMLNDPRGW